MDPASWTYSKKVFSLPIIILCFHLIMILATSKELIRKQGEKNTGGKPWYLYWMVLYVQEVVTNFI